MFITYSINRYYNAVTKFTKLFVLFVFFPYFLKVFAW